MITLNIKYKEYMKYKGVNDLIIPTHVVFDYKDEGISFFGLAL